MSEIEKLYENANADKDCKLYANYGACPDKTKECTYCEYYVYPEFTAEKQLELIKLLSQNCDLQISHFSKWEFIFYDGETTLDIENKNFEETLSTVINKIWQDLTDTEKGEIRRILE